MNEWKYEDIPIGYTQEFTKEITPEMEDAFRKMSGDDNPMHREDAFAVSVSGGRYRQHVVFGMLTASFYSTLAGMYIPGKYSLLHSMELKFLKPVYVGDVLTIKGTVKEKQDDFHLLMVKGEIKNQSGKSVSKAEIKVLVL